MTSDRRPDLFAVPGHDGDDTWPLGPADVALGLALGAIAVVAVVGALHLRERSAGVTLACFVGAIGLGAAHQWWEGRR